MKATRFLAAALAVALLSSCAGAKDKEKTVMEKVSEAEIEKGLATLAGSRVFFGHHSVGWNLIDGLKDLGGSGKPGSLRFVEARRAEDIQGPGFYHSPVGRNMDPLSKIRDFESLLRGGLGRSVDVAFFKFCYVDIYADRDVNALFEEYKKTMSRLKAEFPDLVLVHFTAPLTTPENGIKAAVKRLIGRKTGANADNTNREAYNRLIRAEYGGKAPLFDLALIEASDEAGRAAVRSLGPEEYYTLRPEYTDDGGHLNAPGRQRAAGFLAAGFPGWLRGD